MPERPFKIVITGAESTGKSILAESLANHFGALWIPEYARSYIVNLDHKYTWNDIETIARYQAQQEKTIPSGTKMVFFDTWFIITKVWFEVVFGKCPEWIDEYISTSDIDLFLLCDTDIPWVPDPVRENGGENRIVLHNIYKKIIEDLRFPCRVVSGQGEQRIFGAIDFVNEVRNKTACL